MKRIIALTIFIFLVQNIVTAQNEFGTVGSYWRYWFEPHDGGGSGWTSIKIEKDTIIQGALYKQFIQKHHFQPFAAPVIEHTSIGLLSIKNDSVYVNGNLFLDFDMSIDDSLYLPNVGGILDLQLAIDSIGEEEIGGINYKKWYGQKLCLSDPNQPFPYEPFTILETVGQIDSDYLFWNTDNCSIGGGFNYFVCYRNGDFKYPIEEDCEEFFLTTNTDNFTNKSHIEVFPNPVRNLLNVKLMNAAVNEVSILNIEGKQLIHKKVIGDRIQLNVSELEGGIYLVKIKSEDRIFVNKFVKVNE